MQRFGNTVVIWDLHTRKPTKILDVPGAPLEIRCAWGARNNYCFTSTALTSKIWLIYEDDAGEWHAKDVADIGDASLIPLPVDISISADDQQLWVNTWNDGNTRLFDISDPHAPVQVMKQKIGTQINMVSQSWDGERVYYTSSLLANWDKVEASDGEDLQYFKAYSWNGEELAHQFTVDFLAEKLGTPHQMRRQRQVVSSHAFPPGRTGHRRPGPCLGELHYCIPRPPPRQHVVAAVVGLRQKTSPSVAARAQGRWGPSRRASPRPPRI